LAGVPVYEGFDGFVKFTVSSPGGGASDYVPETYYLGGKVFGDVSQGPPLLMLRHDAEDNLLKQSFTSVDPATAKAMGVIVVVAYDCNRNPVSNARIEISTQAQPGSPPPIPFLLPATRIPIPASPPPYDQPVYTETSGAVGYLNVAPGSVNVKAFRGNDTVPFAEGQLGAVGGELSVASIRPSYLTDANITGVAIEPK